jgi:predicted nucleotidyltransferase component of viral defense system
VGIPAAVEKDWWVVRTLELLFGSSIAPHTVFKGGISLSKAWELIDRFSEDIDLATEKYFPEIREKFRTAGSSVNVQLG